MPEDLDRVVLSEYHAVGSVSGAYMLRQGRFKYHYYVGLQPELFDLANDPFETTNLIDDPSRADDISRLRVELERLQAEVGDHWP